MLSCSREKKKDYAFMNNWFNTLPLITAGSLRAACLWVAGAGKEAGVRALAGRRPISGPASLRASDPPTLYSAISRTQPPHARTPRLVCPRTVRRTRCVRLDSCRMHFMSGRSIKYVVYTYIAHTYNRHVTN